MKTIEFKYDIGEKVHIVGCDNSEQNRQDGKDEASPVTIYPLAHTLHRGPRNLDESPDVMEG